LECGFMTWFWYIQDIPICANSETPEFQKHEL
jgi:hypothetical protein